MTPKICKKYAELKALREEINILEKAYLLKKYKLTVGTWYKLDKYDEDYYVRLKEIDDHPFFIVTRIKIECNSNSNTKLIEVIETDNVTHHELKRCRVCAQEEIEEAITLYIESIKKNITS